MKILFLVLFSFSLFSQDVCEQELEQKCKEKDEIYKCITTDPTNKNKKFSKKCWPKFKGDLEKGKYSQPCLDEVRAACPNSKDKRCFTQKKASLSAECQEFLNDEGIPKAPMQEEVDKVATACKGELEATCGFYRIEMEISRRKGKTSFMDKKRKEYFDCMKRVYLKPINEDCASAFKEYREVSQKAKPSGGSERHEIK